MAGPRFRNRRQFVDLEIAVLDHQRDGRADGLALAHTRDNLRLVGFDLHAATASIALLAAREITVDGREIELETGWQSFHHANQTLAVGFARCEVT